MDSPLSPLSLAHIRKREPWRRTILLSFQTLGVVYGRLSTAPLYVFKAVSPDDLNSDERLYELFSFIFWSLTIIPLLKYALIVLKADDGGEGGTFSLYSILCRHAKVGLLPNDKSANQIMHCEDQNNSKGKSESRAKKVLEKHKSSHYLMLLLALFGSCMIIGDAVLTPAISVLSASSGLERSLVVISKHFSSSDITRSHWEKALKKFVPVPTACAILICLFTLQHYGTHKIGFIFAPIIIIWLLFISIIGLYNILNLDPKILYAVSPVYMYRFMKNITTTNWKILSSIVLCIAGSEAMFADLGHFSKKSIKVTFLCLIYPALVLCYAGQAAFISKHLNFPEEVGHLSEFVPNKIFRHAFAVFSLFASAVGSQATITACFSIINQCQALDCFPRVKVIHTSNKIHGQVYIPDMNWLLMVLSLAVTIGFHDIERIGNATGLAIIFGMLITTCLMSLLIRLYWEKSWLISACFLVFFGSIEAMYLSSCLLSFYKGAWSLVILLVLAMTIMLAWHYGTSKKYQFDVENKVSVDWLTDLSPGLGVSRVPGIGFIYTDIVTGIPAFFTHFITNLPAFHQVLIFVTFKSLPVPCINPSRRFLIGRVGPKEYKIYRCIVRYGYCDHVRDTHDFEDNIIRSIGEFVSMEVQDLEALTSPVGSMLIVGSPTEDGNGNALVPVSGSPSNEDPTMLVDNEIGPSVGPSENGSRVKRKKVRFVLPPKSPNMRVSVREELEELVNARESGTAYFLGQSHLSTRGGSNFIKKFLVALYAFIDRNCRETPVALNIPQAALLEVGMVYTI